MTIQGMVQKLVRKYKTRDPFLIAEYQNIDIKLADFPDQVKGMAVKVKRRKYIVLNESMDYIDLRGVCGHELGHHNLHPGHSYNFIEEHSLFLPGRYEREANEFAAALLIDEITIEKGDTLQNIATKNDIPVELVGYFKPRFDGMMKSTTGKFYGAFKWLEDI